MSKLPHVLSIEGIDNTAISSLFAMADALHPYALGARVSNVLQGAVLINLFLEASTRTRISFGTAFNRLGGSVRDTTGFQFSSLAKGETIEDTARVISGYGDVVVLRHPKQGEVANYAAHSLVPVINAGDGSGEHPTQSLLDLYTIRQQLAQQGKELSAQTVAFIGDLRFGRTVHSLIRLLARYSNIRFVLCSPQGLSLPPEYSVLIRKAGHTLLETENIADALAAADIIYATRVQQERFADQGEYLLAPGSFRISKAMIERFCKQEAIILHPLPRDGREGANDLDASVTDTSDPRVAVFRQADNGIVTRMAVFLHVMGVSLEQVEAESRSSPWQNHRPPAGKPASGL